MMMGHIPDYFAKLLTDLQNANLIGAVTAKVTGYRQAAIGGVWVPGGGVVLPCTYKIYGDAKNRGTVRNRIENAEMNIGEIQLQ